MVNEKRRKQSTLTPLLKQYIRNV